MAARSTKYKYGNTRGITAAAAAPGAAITVVPRVGPTSPRSFAGYFTAVPLTPVSRWLPKQNFQKTYRRLPSKHTETYRNRGRREATASAAVMGEKSEKSSSPVEGDTLVLKEASTYPPLSTLADSVAPPKAVQGPSGWVYHSTSLGCLRPHDGTRLLAIYVVESPIFDPFIMTTIMCNCVTMAWASPLDPPGTQKAAFLASMEWVFLGIFTFELAMKILAYGLICHPHSYLRDAWCQLDFVVVSLAWLPLLFPSMGSMNALRSVRALRPLRALKRVPGMPVLVGSILQSLPPLANVAGVSFFFFAVFGIVGMELFGGVRGCMRGGAHAAAWVAARQRGYVGGYVYTEMGAGGEPG